MLYLPDYPPQHGHQLENPIQMQMQEPSAQPSPHEKAVTTTPLGSYTTASTIASTTSATHAATAATSRGANGYSLYADAPVRR